MSAYRPIRRLNRHYKSNKGFRAWVKANEQWFQENPEVFRQLMQHPNMINLFMDLMMMHSAQIQRRLKRASREEH
jgi:ribosome biogenesis protein Nip4